MKILSPKWPNDLENVGQGQPKFNKVWSTVRCIFCANLVQIRAKLFELSCYNCQIVKIQSPKWPNDRENVGPGQPKFNQVWSTVRCMFCANLVQIPKNRLSYRRRQQQSAKLTTSPMPKTSENWCGLFTPRPFGPKGYSLSSPLSVCHLSVTPQCNAITEKPLPGFQPNSYRICIQ